MADGERVTVFDQYPVGSFSLGGGRRTFFFPVVSISEGGSNRIPRRRRPFRKGAKLDNTGRNEKEFSIECCFDNSIEEPNLDNPPGLALYPHVLNELIDELDTGETGDLQLPTRGKVRCKLDHYNRTESPNDRDGARVTFFFVEDNEDAIDAASFKNPTVRATMQTAVDETVFGMESAGGFSALLEELEDAATALQDAIAAPGEFVADVDQKAARVARLANDVENQFLISSQFGRDMLTRPDSWATVQQLRILQDTTSRAVTEKSSPIAAVITIVLESSMSIFDLAVQLGQDPTDLQAINGHLEDLLYIPIGATVNIFDRSAA